MNQTTTTTYDTDFYAWTQQQANLLRQGELAKLDIEHLIEEIEDMGMSQRRALSSRLQVLISHLLKWQHQPDKRSPSWEATIHIQRSEIVDLLADNPSLRPQLNAFIERAYPKARQAARGETRLPLETFPAVCPYDPEQILDADFFPNA
ncbi:MAG: DUF29 domain-containing protein [Chloroflexi bacterium]|nr:MAG: DUF29 domain-containing protein [Chloroflexota bacterium]